MTDAQPEYVSALVGKGLALTATDRNAEAAEAFRAAVRLDPSLTDIARRVDVLTLRALQEELAAAGEAARNGQPEAAMRAYRNAIAASPDSAFLYRELAGIERLQGQIPAGHRTSATGQRTRPVGRRPPGACLVICSMQQGDSSRGAEGLSTTRSTLEADPSVEAKRSALRARLELAALPEQYRAIDAVRRRPGQIWLR